MARHTSSSYSRRRGRIQRQIYITALVIIAVVIALKYGYPPFGKVEDATSAILMDANIENEANLPAIVSPKPALKPEPEPELLEIVPEPTSESDPKVAELIAETMALVNARPSRIIDARDRLNEVLTLPMSKQQRAFVRKQLSKLADEWLFSRRVFEQDSLCSSYRVKPGDLLSKIGKQFKTPWEILRDINRINRPELLQAGEMIKVIHGPFHAKIYRSTFTMDLYLQNTFVRSFRVGLGRPGMETPTGLWGVKPGGKLIKPLWTNPLSGKTHHPEEPDYPLGSRWIGLEGIKGQAKGRSGFAIHGTKKPEEIGTAGSQGCIRLYNGDAILIYNLLMPGFSQVLVVD